MHHFVVKIFEINFFELITGRVCDDSDNNWFPLIRVMQQVVKLVWADSAGGLGPARTRVNLNAASL